MTKKRLDRDAKWGFQGFPYYQMRVETDFFRGLVSLIDLIEGEYYYWDLPKAGKVPVCGKGMKWLQLIPDGKHRAITAKFLPKSKRLSGVEYENSLSVCYVDVIEGYGYAEDGVAVFEDKYLDVIFSPEGDVLLEDQDELDAAYESGELSEKQYQQAIKEGQAIMEDLCTDIEKTEIWFQKILAFTKKRIETGEDVFSKNTERVKNMKVIFLDVDGVLDIFNTEQYMQVLLKDAVYRLKRIVDETDAKIVVVSNWRYGCDQYKDRSKDRQNYPQECDNWPLLAKALGEYDMEIQDVTPWEDSLTTRSEEILEYLRRHPQIERFVILDDCFSDDYSQYPELQKKLVFVDANRALQDCDVEKAVGMLENDLVELSRVDDNIVIKKVKKENELTLDDIFKDYNGESVAEEFDWGSPVGKEVW